jgi:hypothetical protein
MIASLSVGVSVGILVGACGPRPKPEPTAPTYSGVPVFVDAWSGVTAGAAAGYCLAKHPYQSNTADLYTADGYEKVGVPGVVGAVRRNFVRKRSNTQTDTGGKQSCDMACREFGRDYEPTLQGRALHQNIGDNRLITSGIGDMASLAYPDHDFYLNRPTVAGMASRANTYHENDVAAADYCCCHATMPPPR